MERIIAVDEDLSDLRSVLDAQGYDTVGLSDEDINRADAVIISGMQQNMLLMEDIRTKAPVISADGKTDREILDTLREYFHAVH